MLNQRGFNNVRIWPRGADLVAFNPKRRSAALRRRWGVESAYGPPKTAVLFVGRLSWEKNLRRTCLPDVPLTAISVPYSTRRSLSRGPRGQS
jgi:hypothetical protein